MTFSAIKGESESEIAKKIKGIDVFYKNIER